MNQSIKKISGSAVPLRLNNVDTDQIMPKQFLRGIDKQGLAAGLFHDMKTNADGTLKSDFILNQAQYKEANILISGTNFGCGSSREHAVWGLRQYGFQAIIAPSFAEIFHANALNNRLLLITLAEDMINDLVDECTRHPEHILTIDIENLHLHSQAGLRTSFHLNARHHAMMLDGHNLTQSTLEHQVAIRDFMHNYWKQRPWAKNVGQSITH